MKDRLPNRARMHLSDRIAAMPKTEIHVHLEGSVRPATLLELARRNGVQPPAADEAGLREFFRFRDFPHFIEVYIAVCSCLRTPEDFATIVRELGEDAAAQNIRYLAFSSLKTSCLWPGTLNRWPGNRISK